MNAYNLESMCDLIEKGIRDNRDREILGNSLFYYCCGKDITPIRAFGHKYPLYIYSDIIDYGLGDFYNETQLLYSRLEKHGFKLLDKREIKADKKTVLTMWNSPQQESFFLLYAGYDAVSTFKSIYSDNGNYIQPKCICNYRCEINSDYFSAIEKRTEYILGYCFSDKYNRIAEYDYYGDYEKNTKVTLFHRAFWYVY